jgi:energy-coupling factor transporter ATP-binding protein EcfA2
MSQTEKARQLEAHPTNSNRSKRRSQPLDAAEIADAAITAALVVALLAAGRVLASGSLFQVFASFVVAVLAARRRSRAVIISTCAAASIALILGGLGPVSQAALAGVFGWCGGFGLKREWGRIRTVGFSLLIAWPAMAFSVLFIFPAIAINGKLRTLVFENVENQANGFGNILTGVGGLFGSLGLGFIERAANWADNALETTAEFLIENWLLLIPATELIYSIIYALAIRAVGGAILRRLDRALVEPVSLALQPGHDAAPLPVKLAGSALKRNGVTVTVPLHLEINPGEHVVVEGPNGAGKSTLLDALAGMDNLDSVIRNGNVALGSLGGTARVGQRPEAQVVGTTVEEDLRWGLDTPVDVAATLADVGLTLPEDRPTSELSGGELQRLALASALRRHPKLLLADEVTSMLDPEEQIRITKRLNALTGTAVVRTTHRNDAAPTDRRIILKSANPLPTVAPAASNELRTIHAAVVEARLLRLRDVGFTHNPTQPWALEVLAGIDLSIHRYEMIMIEGRNGSGKTTLARILAGLAEPTAGVVEEAKGVRRALAHQHVRLQLLRPTVTAELHSLAGVRIDEADPSSEAERHRTRADNLATSIDLFELEHVLDRRIDELSGGEQRRVLLAGLVARGVSLLVLDEPLAGLDAAGRSDLAVTLDRVRLAGTSIVVVSHDIEWAPPHVDQRLRLDGGHIKAITP